jgi:hypothetical protein
LAIFRTSSTVASGEAVPVRWMPGSMSDDHGERFARLGRCRGQRLRIGRMVDHQHQVGDLGVELNEPLDGLRRHHR